MDPRPSCLSAIRHTRAGPENPLRATVNPFAAHAVACKTTSMRMAAATITEIAQIDQTVTCQQV